KKITTCTFTLEVRLREDLVAATGGVAWGLAEGLTVEIEGGDSTSGVGTTISILDTASPEFEFGSCKDNHTYYKNYGLNGFCHLRRHPVYQPILTCSRIKQIYEFSVIGFIKFDVQYITSGVEHAEIKAATLLVPSRKLRQMDPGAPSFHSVASRRNQCLTFRHHCLLLSRIR
ncbi:hypothetical protein C0J52_01641, partial [Blattella germanica]